MFRKAQEKAFGGGKSADVWTGIRLGEKKSHWRLNDPLPSSYILSYQSLRATSDDATESQRPKRSHFRLSTATGANVMTRRRALWNLSWAPEAGCVALRWKRARKHPHCACANCLGRGGSGRKWIWGWIGGGSG